MLQESYREISEVEISLNLGQLEPEESDCGLILVRIEIESVKAFGLMEFAHFPQVPAKVFKNADVSLEWNQQWLRNSCVEENFLLTKIGINRKHFAEIYFSMRELRGICLFFASKMYN